MPVFYELFILWSFPFWLLLLAEFAFLFWAVSCRRGVFALLSLVVFVALVQFFGNIPVLQWLWENPWTAVAGLGVWLVASVPWAFTKWWLYVTNNSNRYDEILGDYRAQKPGLPDNVNDFSPEQKVDWKEYFDRHSYAEEWYEYRRVEFYPKVREHKADIMTWMMFWPWSALWTLLNDPIRRFFQHVYWRIANALQKISDSYWKDKAGHMPTTEQIEAVNVKRQAEREEKARQERAEWQAQQDARKQAGVSGH
jgi:hypothetical protein